MRYVLYLVALFLLTTTCVEAQSADTLWAAWLRGQRAAWQDWQQLSVEVEGHHVIDAPYGVRRVRFVAEAHITPERMERRVRLLEVDGRVMPTEAFPRMVRPKPRWLEPLLDHWPPFRLLAGLRPWGPAVADSVDRVACWRFDLQPPGRPPIERITLWFARDDGRLVQSRLLLRGPRMPVPARLQTRFARIEGRDLPVHRRLTWLHPVRRRMRRYTLLITQELFYRDYRFEPAGIP